MGREKEDMVVLKAVRNEEEGRIIIENCTRRTRMVERVQNEMVLGAVRLRMWLHCEH